MHELAVCQAMIRQVSDIAAGNNDGVVERIVVSIGPLSGVEPALLASAFTIARAGTSSAQAELQIETLPLEVRCRSCGELSSAKPNRLLCGHCGDWRVRVTQGEELMLLRVDLRSGSETAHERPAAGASNGVDQYV